MHIPAPWRPPYSSRTPVPALLVVLACCTLSACAPTADAPSTDVAGSRAMFEQSRLRGNEFRAVGQEPGWALDIDVESVLDYTGDYGSVRFTIPIPDAQRDRDGTLTYHAVTDRHDLLVTIRPQSCTDTMSGEAFSHTVSVRVDGRSLEGCGRELGPGL